MNCNWLLHLPDGAGRQIWKYIGGGENATTAAAAAATATGFDREKNVNASDHPYRGRAVEMYNKQKDSDKVSLVATSDGDVAKAVAKAIEYVVSIQSPETGHWPGDYGGPMFLMPGMIIACYVTNTHLSIYHKEEMIKYLMNHQNDDGGWGTHIEKHSTMFGTVLSYVSIRLLGISDKMSVCVNAREFMTKHGGAIGIPSWGKFWLCVLGVYEYEGINPVPPELWLLPEWLPFHPSKMWCHCRMVYLCMSYLYGARFVYAGALNHNDPLIDGLRREIFSTPYSKIDWSNQRNCVSVLDLYRPHHFIMQCVNKVLGVYEYFAPSWLRKKALDHCIEHIAFEDTVTNYICIGPVNKVMNMICQWHRDPTSLAYHQHTTRLDDYLWVAEDGMKMQGYNGSQLWDAAFMVQSILESKQPYLHTNKNLVKSLDAAHTFLYNTQVLEDVPNNKYYYRHISKGAWPFSTRDHGWPISDCSAEGLKTALLFRQRASSSSSSSSFSSLPSCALSHPISDERLDDAVNFLLSMQNEQSGGWATYELTRSGSWLEMLNPSEVFGDIMIDYPYVECTSASVQALHAFVQQFPKSSRKEAITASIQRGLNFIRSIQRPDGSWYGSWAVCFTYGTWFAVEALTTILKNVDVDSDATLARARSFLLSKQNGDGGYGESCKASEDQEWRGCESQVVHTAWALLCLVRLGERAAAQQAAAFLMRRQLKNGDWPQERITGVFNGSCTISYTNYRNAFPLWALSRYMNVEKENN